MTPSPKITVYIPCHNYGRFLAQAVESVLRQTREDWELILIDDGSRDATAQIAAGFLGRHPDRVRLIRHPEARGLRACANAALQAARGEYILRLDADDYLDDNALLVLASALDRHPEVSLVYPNYTYVDEVGNVLGVEHRKRVGLEAQLLDLPAHGAGSMIRTQTLKSLGGYDERHDGQDGHELWLKMLHRYGIASVHTPLFYYRQHPASKSNDEARLLKARQGIKQEIAKGRDGAGTLRRAAIVPAKNTYAHLPDIVLREVAGSPLIDYTLQAALQTGLFEQILVTTDDPRVVEHCERVGGVSAILRSPGLSGERAFESQVVLEAVQHLEQKTGLRADLLAVLSVHTPLRRAEHIQEAVDTLLLYNADSVLSVYEDCGLHFVHGKEGLTPLNPAMHRQIRLEREGLYESNGAVRVLWRDILTEQDLAGRRVGHITMTREESFQIKSLFDLRLMEHLLLQRAQEQGKVLDASRR